MLKEDIFNFFSSYIHTNSGIRYNEDNVHGLEMRLENLALMLSLKSIDEVYAKFKNGVTMEMHEMIIDLATNNETSFFRDKRPFDLLSGDTIPDLVKTNSTVKNLFIWSAACSTGQEPYSILMWLFENNPELAGWRITVDATDLSPRVLEQAKNGIYTQLQVQRGMPIKLLQKYFYPGESNSWVIDKKIRSSVNFSRFNLLDKKYPVERYDIVFCRNVLIYFDNHKKTEIIDKLCGSLISGGYLFMGNGESLYKVSNKFEQIVLPNGVVFKKNLALGTSKK